MSLPSLFFFDEQRFGRDLAEGNPIQVFKDALNAGTVQFDRRFAEGEDVRTLVRERAAFIDRILAFAWQRFAWDDDICLIAVGGYGRGELHPHSDIDLLLLFRAGDPDRYRDSIEGFLTLLWDIQLDIGHSVRSLDQCVEEAAKDITVATNLMECRTLMGDDTLRDTMVLRTGPEHIWPAADFFQAKVAEQEARHDKYKHVEYNLEPNVKNQPGGLRDIQTIAWVAKRHYLVRNIQELLGSNFFSEEEYGTLRSGEEFLWRVRYGLHMLAGRAEERLLFDYQRELAKRFGYHDSEGKLAVEQFMQRYYRVVGALRELNDVLLNFLDENILHQHTASNVSPLNSRFQLRDRYIEVVNEQVFDEYPPALLEIFVLMGSNPAIEGVRASTIRLLREKRHLIDDAFRADPRNNRLFLRLLRTAEDPARILRRMLRYGILGRYLPEFGAIIGQMQHDLFHIYTVDAHTLQLVENIVHFGRPQGQEHYPVAAQILRRLPKPELLYLGAIYHDIAKGRGGDHSTLGAVDAIAFGERHKLSPWDTKLIAWLVEKHLLMSRVSQKEDISDPDVIHKFASEIGDLIHLDYLYCLTVADINATNPELWTTWRASLLRQLYFETKRALRRGLENPIDKQDWIDDTQRTALRQLKKRGYTPEQVEAVWSDVGDDYFLRESAGDIVWHTQEMLSHIDRDQPLVLIKPSGSKQFEGATQIFVRTHDRPNVFAAVTSALDQLNLNIQDARLYSAGTGYTLDTFYVLEHDNQPLGNDPQRLARIKQVIAEELQLVAEYPDIVRRRTPRQIKSFAMPTRATISNDISTGLTVLEVISPDRPGLLARIARVFMDFDVQLVNAKIATLGERVEDVFFITGPDGEALSNPDYCTRLQQAICRALDEHVENSQQITL